jgi:hypothetical protein
LDSAFEVVELVLGVPVLTLQAWPQLLLLLLLLQQPLNSSSRGRQLLVQRMYQLLINRGMLRELLRKNTSNIICGAILWFALCVMSTRAPLRSQRTAYESVYKVRQV